MKIGTKSVLYGAHCFLIHPIFVAIAWIKLYGFPFDPRIWIAFFMHDLGYWGKPNMDGPEGETHVELGARIMGFLFDRNRHSLSYYVILKWYIELVNKPIEASYKWQNFTKYHSRFYAKKEGAMPSNLCFADKMAMCIEPDWFYLFRVNLSGEINEYMQMAEARNLAGEKKNQFEKEKLSTKSQKDWRIAVVSYVKRWVEEHKDGRFDSWTPSAKTAINNLGVYK
jgi:hypothetical protein